jgi:hypothetical protein
MPSRRSLNSTPDGATELDARPDVEALAMWTTIVAAAAVALFAIWLTADLSRPLVYATWWGFSLLAAWLIGVALLTARRSLRNVA